MRPAVPVREGGPLAVEGLGERAHEVVRGLFLKKGVTFQEDQACLQGVIVFKYLRILPAHIPEAHFIKRTGPENFCKMFKL